MCGCGGTAVNDSRIFGNTNVESGVSDANGEITCLSFEKNFQGSRGVWVSNENVRRVSRDCPSGQGCVKFSRPQRPYNSRLSIPRFAYSFSAWSAFSL